MALNGVQRVVRETHVRDIMEKTGTGVNRLNDAVLDELHHKVEQLIIDACKRAKANSRVGLKPEDF